MNESVVRAVHCLVIYTLAYSAEEALAASHFHFPAHSFRHITQSNPVIRDAQHVDPVFQNLELAVCPSHDLSTFPGLCYPGIPS